MAKSRKQVSRAKPKRRKALDAVTLEVIRNALPAIANEMAADLQRTSYNMMIYEVRDFCTSLVNTKGELISQNVGGVSHFVADLGVIITDAMARYGAKGFAPGDVIITNHQAVAGQHLNNIVIYTPYFFKGELLDVRHGARALDRRRRHDDRLRRRPDRRRSMAGRAAARPVQDLRARQAQRDALPGAQGQHPLPGILARRHALADGGVPARGPPHDELFDKYGRDTILDAIAQIFDETERKCRNVVEKLPDGVYEAGSFIDDDGVKRGERVPIHAKVTVDHGSMTIDLSGSSGERKAAINSRTYAGARVAYKALTGPLEPVNEGSFRALKVIIPEGNIMMARYPAPMAGWSLIVPTVVDTIITALAKAMPDRVPAGHHGLLGGSIVFFGVHPKTQRRFVVQSIEGGGWGGRPSEDGESGTVSVCQGDVRNASIEGIELKCPVLVEGRALRTDSGGAGKHRGGLGIDTSVRNLVEGRWNFDHPKRVECPPWGLWGGTAGTTADFLLRKPGENDFRSMDAIHYPVPVDSEVIVRTGGGGGWGDPLERDAAAVRSDVIEEFVSRRFAEETYGVVLRDDLTLDEAATEQRRNALRSGRG